MAGELVYLGVGSNIGDRKKSILNAQRQVENILSEFRRSSIYETPPMYQKDQPEFLNCVFCGFAHDAPVELLNKLQAIERRFGRDRNASGPMGPRPLDLDILLFGRRVIHTEKLVVPHPRMYERAFVLVPLIELDPLLRDPKSGLKYADLAAGLSPEGIYYYTG